MKFKESLDIASLDNRFQDILKAKRNYKGEYPLIDFGIGEEKEIPSSFLLSALELALKEKENHKYSDRGSSLFYQEAKNFFKRTYALDIHENEMVRTLGNKEALSILPSFIIDKGDIVISTKPGYIVLETVASFYGAKILSLPLLKENNFLPDFSSIDEDTWKKVKIVSLNYPNNPTGATATEAFYKDLIQKAKQYGFIIVNDAAYMAYSYEEKPLPLLSIEGAKDVAVEVYTFSKAYNMTGFRIGLIVGNEEIIRRYRIICDFFDSGQYTPIEKAATYALKHREITNALKEKYYERMTNIVSILTAHGLEVDMAKGTYYLYVKVPVSYSSAHAFSLYLLKELGIMTIPYDEAGSYIRISMTYEAKYDLPFYLELDRRLRKLHL